MIALAADHAGFPLKEEIKKHLSERGFEVKDFGTDSEKSVDYAFFAKTAIAEGHHRGAHILIGIVSFGDGVRSLQE